MNSLVAYDDSDSDEDGGQSGRSLCAEAANRISAGRPKFNFTPWHSPAPALTGASTVYQDPHGQNTHTMPSFPRTAFHSPSDSGPRSAPAYPAKRPSASGDGVRPYIPKRLKQGPAQEVQSSTVDALQEQPVATTTTSIYRLSDYLGPHLQLKYKETGIPRRVVFQMKEHAGPVNRVQWCPVKQHSHLLLSASMDATVKVWDAMDTGRCLHTISSHRLAVRDAQWSVCGKKILSGGFDSHLHLTDVETGKDLLKANNEWKIGAVRFHPNDPNAFICAGFSSTMKAWDVRTNKVIHVYKAAVQQHFDILFLPGGKEFLSSTDSVSRDSADRTIIAWDFATAAKISNQIFHERYTCPSFALHPKDNVFAAQTNGNYIAIFSTQRPYKMNKQKRFEGHKVEGFAVGCEFSPDGSLMVTGSSDGCVQFYNYNTCRALRTLPGDGAACVSVHYHRVMASLMAAAYWDGQIRVWQ
ncbi:WD repeat-containing protein 25 [Gastrophryne carolinensis]